MIPNIVPEHMEGRKKKYNSNSQSSEKKKKKTQFRVNQSIIYLFNGYFLYSAQWGHTEPFVRLHFI